MADFTPWLLLLFVLLSVLLAIAWWWERGRIRRGNVRRLRTAQKGESDAELLLESEGYLILERQISLRWMLWVNGEPQPALCRADLRVERDGLEFIAEVKTGSGTDPTKPTTRRQLLEYLHVFDVAGVLLVDPMAKEVLEVRFEAPDSG